MKKVFIHKNGGKPIYIARCEDGMYHVTCQDKLMSSHGTIGLAISNAMNEFIAYTSGAIDGWVSHA